MMAQQLPNHLTGFKRFAIVYRRPISIAVQAGQQLHDFGVDPLFASNMRIGAFETQRLSQHKL